MNSRPTDTPTPRIAVFASGNGSNFEALAQAAQDNELSAAIVLVVTDRPEAGVRDRAANFGIPSVVIRPRDFPDESEYVSKLGAVLDSHEVGYVALAGYLKKIPSDIVRRFRHRMTNIHPALLPSFGGKGMYGRRVHEAVIEHGVRWSGVTVHLVDEEYDTGPIILQEPVPVYETDTVAELAARVLQVEHQLYPRAVRLLAEGRLRLEGRRVVILPEGA